MTQKALRFPRLEIGVNARIKLSVKKHQCSVAKMQSSVQRKD